ncbi:MAG: hypothetical protein AAF327_05640 [Cyanobacteria bacterium P01_A01_bin.37]
MVSTKSFPWISLSLLFASYSTFSWFLYNATVNWLIWALVIVLSLFEALLLTTFTDGLKSIIDSWLQSDLGYFTSVIIGALLLAVALVWINLFGYVLVLLASEMLARLDLQNFGCNRFQSLLVLTGISLLGLFLGQSISRVL